MVVLETLRRMDDVSAPLLNPFVSEPKTKHAQYGEILVIKLKLYANDTVGFIRDFGWAPDPKLQFGAKQIPEGMSPKGMVPLLLFPKQEDLIVEWDRILEADDPIDFWMDKCRQVAATTFFLWWGLHKWLFKPGTTGLITTYDKELIDKGGKGQRDATSLFGRLRMFIDAFMWSLSLPTTDGGRQCLVKFNAHKELRKGGPRVSPAKLHAAMLNITGMEDSDDVGYKLVRPKWTVFGIPLAPGAEGNILLGDTAGDSFGRSNTGTWSLMDEFPHLNSNMGAGTDRATHKASVSNTKCRFFIGTPPSVGGSGTMMHEVVTGRNDDLNTVVWHFDWTDLPVYLMGAHWTCPACDHPNDWDFRVSPGDQGIDKDCAGCRTVQRVTRFNMTSPWFRATCARMRHDKIGIAAEVQRDWGGVVGDRLFAAWHDSTDVRPYLEPRRVITLDGFDPGFSVANPASWISAVFDCVEHRFQIVGYWMAAEAYIEYFVPFFKRWHPRQMERATVGGGQFTGMKFREAFDYDPEALKMMERMHSFRDPDGQRAFHPVPVIGGDKYGSHQNMMQSPYDLLAQKWGVNVYWEYTTDREMLVKRGQEWVARMTIDSEIADVTPPTPLGRAYPSVRDVFQGAKPKPHGGHGEYRLDVDKQDPPNVNHGCDAWFYLIRMMETEVLAQVGMDGQWSPQEYQRNEEPVYYGGFEG